MPGHASLFREIHRVRRYLRDLQEQLDRIPRQIAAHQARIQKREEELRTTQEQIKKFKVLASEKEKGIQAQQARLSRYEEQNNQVTSKKEYDALQLEIAAARTLRDKLEDEALQALTECEEREEKIPGMQQGVADARAELARYQADVAPRKTDLDAQRTQAQTELQGLEVQVPEDLRPQYRRIIVSRQADGMAAVKNGNCTACYTEIIPQAQSDLEADKFVVCGSCGRILYLPEQPRRSADEDE
jgi:predicted  nucleic acid-binding Zn-ribbon protein